MQKRVFIVHGWDGTPDEPMHKWLKEKLEENGFEVTVPEMPNTSEPKIEEWVNHLGKIVDRIDNNTYFIGHSIGCQTIMRFLEKQDVQIGGAVFIAGWLKLDNLEGEEVEKIAKPWLTTPINFDKIKKVINKLTVIISDNDYYNEVKYNSETFKKKLGAKIIIKKNMGHFTEEDGVNKLPEALKEISELAK